MCTLIIRLDRLIFTGGGERLKYICKLIDMLKFDLKIQVLVLVNATRDRRGSFRVTRRPASSHEALYTVTVTPGVRQLRRITLLLTVISDNGAISHRRSNFYFDSLIGVVYGLWSIYVFNIKRAIKFILKM